tara:strand:- start:2241 stop:2630 length:390 start_codon:yes stop_codon:yes gene_type:complete
VKGEDHYKAKVTNDQVVEICKKLDKGVKQKYIAEEYGITQASVSEIHRGHKWNWLTGRRGENNKYSKKGSKNPAAKKVINCKGEVFDTIKEAAAKYRVDSSSLSKVCKGLRNSLGKYKDGSSIKWSYVN